jgi:hypothetical protein
MSTLYLQLLEVPATKKPLDTARAYIAIKSCSTVKVDEKEFTTISAECRTLKEVQEVVDWLIKELKSIKEQAAKFFRKEDETKQKMLEQSPKQ